MTKQEFISLYEKFVDGQCTEAEKKLLEGYRDDIVLSDNKWDDLASDENEIRNRIWASLEIVGKGKQPVIPRRRFLWLKAAAVLLVGISAVMWLTELKQPQNAPIVYNKKIQQPVVPGDNKAFLTLANGATIILNDAKNGKLLSKTGIQVTKAKNGVIVYQIKPVAVKNNMNAVAEFNTITTPRGGQYQVLLSDGSKVWLNAASSLRYPIAFVGSERKVQLQGEAYFEVAKNKEKPFIVHANGTDVKVLGTHFNVNAYADNSEVTTTLLEGSVRLSKDVSTALLEPGQQGIIPNKGGQITIKQADIEEAVAWKNGLFVFHDAGIVDIMKQVSRWYDVDVTYEGDVKTAEFGGVISRYKDITELLNNMELTTAIHYKLEGRRVIIMK